MQFSLAESGLVSMEELVIIEHNSVPVNAVAPAVGKGLFYQT